MDVRSDRRLEFLGEPWEEPYGRVAVFLDGGRDRPVAEPALYYIR